jgi:nicotinate phosphoribosyltransferase
MTKPLKVGRARVVMHTASFEDIKAGKTTDIYFVRTKKILEAKGITKNVVAEFTVQGFEGWGVLAGIEEATELLQGLPLDVYAFPEGSLFFSREPVMRIEGEYSVFCELETPLLGFLCQASGIATRAAHLRKLTEKPLLSFGIRRMHPAIAPMIDRAAYIGGMDGFSGIAAERIVRKKASGTMPHALMIVVGDVGKAFRYFDEVTEKEVQRIALVDTYNDEKVEALIAAESIENLAGVRLDTPGSRRGNMRSLIDEVRWELDVRGYKGVKIYVSGGVTEKDICELTNADAFGVGTAISNAPTINFAMDIIEMDGRPCAKRGKFGGKKEVFRCSRCMRDEIVYKEKTAKCDCGKKMEPILKPLIRQGKIVESLPAAEKIRDYVLEQIQKV